MRKWLRGRFLEACEAIDALAAGTVRASSLVENLYSQLRKYFTLRRHLGSGYLSLLQFFLNHRVPDRSERPEREGKTPAEVLTGRDQPHWLEMLGFKRFARNWPRPSKQRPREPCTPRQEDDTYCYPGKVAFEPGQTMIVAFQANPNPA